MAPTRRWRAIRPTAFALAGLCWSAASGASALPPEEIVSTPPLERLLSVEPRRDRHDRVWRPIVDELRAVPSAAPLLARRGTAARTAAVLTEGVRYDRPLAMADHDLELRLRAPGKGRAFVTLEFGF